MASEILFMCKLSGEAAGVGSVSAGMMVWDSCGIGGYWEAAIMMELLTDMT